MQIAVAVGVGDLFVVHLAQPVVGGDRAGVVQNQPAHGIGNGGIFFHTPVGNIEIVIDRPLIVEQRRFDVAQFFALLAVKNIAFGNFHVSRLNQNDFHAVLNVFNGYHPVLDLMGKIRGNAERKALDNVVRILHLLGVERLFYGDFDFAHVERHDASVSLLHLKHIS